MFLFTSLTWSLDRYVDEAQDNLLIDVFSADPYDMSIAHSSDRRPHTVLRNLCRNPHGMFWAGDTAQTISAGSAFRFNDLKAFMYRLEEVSQFSLSIHKIRF